MLQNFLKRIRKYKKDVIIAIIFTTTGVVLESIIPYLMSIIIDRGIAVENMNVILGTGGLLVLATLTSLTFGIIASKFLARSSAGFANNIREDLYNHISYFSFQNIDKFNTSSLITRLTTDISSLQQVFGLAVRVSSRSPFLMLFSLFMAFAINARLALVFVFVLPILGLIIFFIIKKAFPLFKIALKTYDDLNNVVSENLKGIRVVKSFVREDFEVQKFKKVSSNIYDTFSGAEKVVAFFQPATQLAIYICMVLIAWFGARLIIVEDLTVGELMGFILYINQILFSLVMISMLFINLAMSRASGERIAEVLDEKIVLKNPDNPVIEIENYDIEFKNVFFGYSENKFVLENINLNIKSGSTIGILGGTGSSKTSLVQLIPRLYDVSLGSVALGGIDVKDLDMGKLRENCVIVLQKNTLFAGTIIENLKWGDLNATKEDMENACKIAKAHDFIMSMPNGYDTLIDQGGANLSGGQRQRICIARAILKNPKIIIFDDSTSAVDTTTEREILKGLKENLVNTTKIIISQRISSVKELDTIILLNDRKIIGMGTHDTLLETNEIYREIEKSQTREDI
ncbi:MAG: ABC transporter ATP-binding protein/permease [Defluviitaleaceae bacterium]|nr:ABC transporter ATP-binding protein/permease [Defluviitaleaceae bacterium]